MAHGMGSGKTVTALWVARHYIEQKRVPFVNIVAPNVAVVEFLDSFQKAGINPTVAGKIRVLTHDEFVDNKKRRSFAASLVIVDEAHVFTKTKYSTLVKYNVRYIMLLSGTPAPNSADEIVPLINLLCKSRKDTITKKAWNQRPNASSEKVDFMKDKVAVFNIGSGFNYMGKIDGQRVARNEGLPGYVVKKVRVKLTGEQENKYLQLVKLIDRDKSEKRPSRKLRTFPFFQREKRIVYAEASGGGASAKIARVARDIVGEFNNGSDKDRLERGRMMV